MAENTADKKSMKLVAPGRNDNRFLLPTVGDGDGSCTTYAEAYPQFFSEGTDEQFEGDAIRSSVIPCMMQHMDEAIRKIDLPDIADPLSREKNRTLMLISEAGLGKTTMTQVLSKAFKCKAHLIDCFDTDISELVAETTIDGHYKWATLEKNINDKIKNDTLKPTSMAVVQEKFAGMFHDDGTIDFSKAPKDSAHSAHNRMIALQEIAENEGLISRGGAHLISKVPGKLYHALKEAKESKVPVIITLDEYTRRRDAGGGDPILYEVLAGTRQDEITVDGGNGEKFTLSNADLRRSGSLVIFTGNYLDARDDSIKPSPDALKSRLPSIGIEQAGMRDWAHRIQQLLSGIPVSTVYDAQRDRWEGTGEYMNEKSDFGQYLLDLRSHGLSEEQQKNVPIAHYSFISNYTHFKDGTEQLAGFMYDLAQMENPKSSLYDRHMAGSPSIGKMRSEVSNRPKNHPASQIRIDLRLIQNWLEEAMSPGIPKVEKGKKPKRRPELPSAPEEQFGTRLIAVINDRINQMYPEGNPHNVHIREYVEALMLKHALYTPATKKAVTNEVQQLLEATDVRTTGDIQPVASLLNTPREQGKDANVKTWQEILALAIQHAYPDQFDAGVTLQPSQVISYSAVSNMLDTMVPGIDARLEQFNHLPVGVIPAIETIPPEPGAKDTQFSLKIALQQAVFSRNIEEVMGRLDGNLKGPMEASWKRLTKGGKDAKEQSDPSALRLLMTLALPGAAKKIIPKLFPTMSTAAIASLQISTGAPNDSNLGITTFQPGLNAEGNPEMVQILVRFKNETGPNGKTERAIERAVLIGDGEPIPQKLAELLAKAGNVAYISRKDKNAESMIRAEVDDMLRYGNESRKAAAKEKVMASDKYLAAKDEKVRETLVKSGVEQALRGKNLQKDMQFALTLNTSVRRSFLESIQDQIPEIKNSLDSGNTISAANAIVGKEVMSLSEMLLRANEVFELDKPIMLMQNNLPEKHGKGVKS